MFYQCQRDPVIGASAHHIVLRITSRWLLIKKMTRQLSVDIDKIQSPINDDYNLPI